ncbi:diguanylate cyclase [Thermoanaerobacter siderophilus]|uniref:Diguanylate cyclase (GGDEF) domain-containing protein n=1 Tax=Thermoanaerobacter siderophilus SR4 TaxID=880478 RepID=I9KUR8_9THEO|nr:diguanylate cyclase [Thermoanaerobacter siderophilus]EIW00621.1 diguanylate cyclase (GGDEF) domain-containing protein [Thermoanaerobacter siderophilus SR4]
MPTNLLLNISLKYWQDFQDTLAKVMGTNIYIFDVNGNPFSEFSQKVEVCQNVNNGNKICDKECITFYKNTLTSLQDKGVFTCPYGVRLYAYRLGTHVQKIGFLIVTPNEGVTEANIEKENTFAVKANNIYQTINEVLRAIIEKNILGLRRLELNSIYEISRLLISTVELDKVLELIINSLIIIYRLELGFIGLREGDKIKIAKAKGEYGQLLVGKEWSMIQPVIEKIFSKVEPSFLDIDELKTLTGFTNLEIDVESKTMIYPLWTSIGAVGLLGIMFSPDSVDDNDNRNLQIYVNFAAIALANAKIVSRIEKEAETDFLTGFFNKRAIRNMLISELERTVRYRLPLAVIFLDIDNFKTYNDTFGHVAGDVMLQKTAEIIKNSIRTVDIAGRFGGEEFIIILPGTDEEGAVAVAERIRKTIENYPFPHRRVTASLGITLAKNSDSVESLLERADRALYQAKREGKNRCCLVLS